MPTTVVDEFVIPRCTGKAFRVAKGQVLRVIEHEGKTGGRPHFLKCE